MQSPHSLTWTTVTLRARQPALYSSSDSNRGPGWPHCVLGARQPEAVWCGPLVFAEKGTPFPDSETPIRTLKTRDLGHGKRHWNCIVYLRALRQYFFPLFLSLLSPSPPQAHPSPTSAPTAQLLIQLSYFSFRLNGLDRNQKMHSLHTGPLLGLTIIQKEYRLMGLTERNLNPMR